jgi:GNAT superfamily N-acetyltransferase
MGGQTMAKNKSDKVVSRPIRDDNDFWKIRDLLDETYQITPTGFNWEVRRWDGRRFYNKTPDWDPRWKKQVRIWETVDGKIVGAVHPEGKGGNIFLQLHPDFRIIEEEMIAWGEDNLARPMKDGKMLAKTFVFDYDSPRRLLLEKRGFEKTESGGVLRRFRFANQPLPPKMELANDYKLDIIRGDNIDDCQKLADLLNAAFNRDFHTAEEFFTFSKYAPCYCNDMDLVAVESDGTYAAYAGIPFNRDMFYGIFEPVCTHPDHQRQGLAKALMIEGLYRLKALGAKDVYVGTGDQIAANKLYDSIGFTEV